jgi:hypothetical protein
VSPVNYQLYNHHPDGRSIWYQYDATSAAWIPIISYGTMTVYVDATDGTDDANHGTGVDSDAFQTIQYAIDTIPPIFGGTVSIYINDESYVENVIILGKKSSRNCNIKIYGTLTEVASLVATGGVKGATTATPSVTGTFVANVHNNKLLKFTSGSNDGEYGIVGLTTTTNIYLARETLPAQPANNDTYKIYTWGATITGNFQQALLSGLSVDYYDIAFAASSGTAAFNSWGTSYPYLVRCSISTTGAEYALSSSQGSGEIYYSLISATGNYVGIELENDGGLEVNSTKIVGSSGAVGIRVFSSSRLEAFRRGSEISGFTIGIWLLDNSMCQGWTPDVYNFIHGCSTAGIAAANGGQFRFSEYIVYGKKLDNSTTDANGTNESATAASYGYID